MNVILNLLALFDNHQIHNAPEKRTYYAPHSEVTIGIGVDYSANLTLDNEGFKELGDLRKQEIRGCSFGQAIDAMIAGRRIAVAGDCEGYYYYNHEDGRSYYRLCDQEEGTDSRTESPLMKDFDEDWIILSEE